MLGYAIPPYPGGEHGGATFDPALLQAYKADWYVYGYWRVIVAAPVVLSIL
jgi:hypothetical protein